MRVEDALRVLLGGAVVARHKVQHIAAALLAVQNRRDGVVRHAPAVLPGTGQNVCRSVGVIAPRRQQRARKLHHRAGVLARHAHGAHGPAQRLNRKLRIVGVRIAAQRFRALHRERIVAALEMHMAQNAAADDGQVGVAAAGVVRELAHKIEQLRERIRRDAHRRVLVGKHDAVLVVINVRAVLQIPGLAAQLDGHDAVVLPRGEIHAPGIADILDAQHAFRIAGGGLQPFKRDGFRILLGLRQVDRDLQFAVLAGVIPLDVFGDLRGADVVRLDAEIVEIVRGGAHAPRLPQCGKARFYLALARHQRAHDARLEIDAQRGDLAVIKAALRRVVQQRLQQLGGRIGQHLWQLPCPRPGKAEQIEQRVARHIYIGRADERVAQAELQQFLDAKRGVFHGYSS